MGFADRNTSTWGLSLKSTHLKSDVMVQTNTHGKVDQFFSPYNEMLFTQVLFDILEIKKIFPIEHKEWEISFFYLLCLLCWPNGSIKQNYKCCFYFLFLYDPFFLSATCSRRSCLLYNQYCSILMKKKNIHINAQYHFD